MVLNSRFVSLAALCTLVTVFFPSTVHVAAASVHHYDSNIKARDGSQATDHVYLRSTYPSVKYTHDRIDRRGRNNMHDEKSAQETSRGKKGTEHFKKQGYVIGPNKRHSTSKANHDYDHDRYRGKRYRDQPDRRGKNDHAYSHSRIHIYGQKEDSDQHIHEHVHEYVHEHRRSNGEQSYPHGNGSLVLHDSGGTSYVVQSSTHSRRQYTAPDSEVGDEDQRVPGTVDIMANSTSTGQQQRLGSLVIEKSANSTNDASFSLNASNTNQTQFYLVAFPNNVSNADTSSNGSMIVKLELDVYDPSKAALVPYCATFDPKPSKAQALMMEPCSNEFETEEHTSQLFTYNTFTGVVDPRWEYGINGTNATGSHSNSTSSAGPVPSAPSNSSAVNTEADSTFNDRVTGDPLVSRDSSSSQSAQSLNVILVFAPAAPQVTPSGSPVNSSSPAPPNQVSAANETEATTTITTQVTTTTTVSTAGPSPNTMDAATSTSGTNTTTSAPISSTTAAATGSLDVEWIAAPTNTSSSTTSASYSTSMNAEAVASSIANSGSASTTKTASISTSTTTETAASTSSGSSTPSSPAVARAASYQWKFKAEREYER